MNDHDVNEEHDETRNLLTSIARGIDMMLNGFSREPDEKPDVGFILLVFPFEGHEGNCNFISNSESEDVAAILKKQAESFEEKLKDGTIRETMA